MDTRTGRIVMVDDGAPMPAGHIEVKRPITVREQRRMKIDPYSPCGCGSGKKFKFCCYQKPSSRVLNTKLTDLSGSVQ